MKAALMKHLSQIRDVIFMSETVLPVKRRNDDEDDDGSVAAMFAVGVLMYKHECERFRFYSSLGSWSALLFLLFV